MGRARIALWGVLSAGCILPAVAAAQTPAAQNAPASPSHGHPVHRPHPTGRTGLYDSPLVPGGAGAGPVFGPAAAAAPPQDAVDPFPGNFLFASNTTVAISSPISTTESRSTRETAEITTVAPNTERLVVTSENGERCVLTGTRAGANGIAFAPGQQCGVTDSVHSMHLNLTLRAGTGTLTGDVLALQFEWGVEAQAFLPVSGLAAQRSTGSRVTTAQTTATAATTPVAGPAPSAGPPAMPSVQPMGPAYGVTTAPSPMPAYGAPGSTAMAPAGAGNTPLVTFGLPQGGYPANGYPTAGTGAYPAAYPNTAPGVYTYPAVPPYATRAPSYAPTPYPYGYPTGYSTTAYPTTGTSAGTTGPRGYPYVYPPPDPTTAQPLYLPGYGGPVQIR